MGDTMAYDHKADTKPTVRPKHGKQSVKDQLKSYRRVQAGVSDAQRKKPPVTLPAVKSLSED